MYNHYGKWAFYHICFGISTLVGRLYYEYKRFIKFIQEVNGFFLMSGDYLIVWTTIMENERFLITIYVFLFALVLKYYSMNQKYLNNLYKRSMDVFFLLSHD